tara:strand:+ start:457 stop:675 length:219 start_codon:yes stop_codon:yes gene_type:complete
MKDLEAKYRKAARRLYHAMRPAIASLHGGHIEVDEKAEVFITLDVVEKYADGCYVQAWVWVCAEEIEEEEVE